ncbi:hypothetical protein PMI31_05715, partial [Pseudomonas sp. GM55]
MPAKASDQPESTLPTHRFRRQAGS